MEKKLTFLGIETSCDETAASIVQENLDGSAKVLSSIVSSQIKEHEKFGGIVPELAARSHVENIEFIISKALKDAKVNFDQIDGVAATAGPGLIVCLTVGLNIGKAIAGFAEKPFVAVNHLEGHALSPALNNKIKFPYLLLLISGGHSQYLIVNDVNDYKQIGTTIDDALGEAFDKTAKMLNLGYPGGPAVEKFAKQGDKNFYKLPQPIINKAGCNLSFAGLKTAVLIQSKKIKDNNGDYIQDANGDLEFNITYFLVGPFTTDDTFNNCLQARVFTVEPVSQGGTVLCAPYSFVVKDAADVVKFSSIDQQSNIFNVVGFPFNASYSYTVTDACGRTLSGVFSVPSPKQLGTTVVFSGKQLTFGFSIMKISTELSSGMFKISPHLSI